MNELIRGVGGVVNSLIVLVAGIALLIFFWGLARFLLKNDGSKKAVEDGRNTMGWGLLTLFVMMSVWGIITFFQKELNLRCGTLLYRDGTSLPVVCTEVIPRPKPSAPNIPSGLPNPNPIVPKSGSGQGI